jgi:hypothetical protein
MDISVCMAGRLGHPMTDPQKKSAHEIEGLVQQLANHLAGCYPKAVLLFGSSVGYLDDPLGVPYPNDLDILLVSDNPLLGLAGMDFHPPVQLHRFRVQEVTAVARSLRYDPRPLALSKLYAKNVVKQHARDVIVASMLLGPTYNEFGIEQIEINGLLDTRDYSRHRVLYGKQWWERLTTWSRQRSGFFKRLADKAISADRFS